MALVASEMALSCVPVFKAGLTIGNRVLPFHFPRNIPTFGSSAIRLSRQSPGKRYPNRLCPMQRRQGVNRVLCQLEARH